MVVVYTIRACLSCVSSSSWFVIFWGRGRGRWGGQGMRVTLPLEGWTCAALQISGTHKELRREPRYFDIKNNLSHLGAAWQHSHHTPDDVVYTVDLLIGGNVGFLPVFFMISDFGIGACRRHACLGNKRTFYFILKCLINMIFSYFVF